MKRWLALFLALVMALSLAACGGGDGPSSDNDDDPQSSQQQGQNGSETEPDEDDEQTDPPDETGEPDGDQQSGEGTETEYTPGAWITDNVRVTFYKNYIPEGENTKLVLSVYGDRALFQAIKPDGSISAETLYVQTNAGVTTESFLIPGVESTYLTMDSEGQTLKTLLPGILDIMTTFEQRAATPDWLGKYGAKADGRGEQAGRKCTRYTAGASILQQVFLIDDEFGIILRQDTVAQKDGKEETVNFSLVEALEYGVVTAADVPESLTGGSEPAETGEASELDQSQVYEAWAPLVGYWHASDGRFFLLDMADSHSAYFEEGIWDTSYGRGGHVTGLSLTGDTIHQGTAHYDAVEATEMDEAQEAKDVSLTVDWTDLDNDGKIRITVDGEEFYCAYAGAAREEAYAVHQQNLSDIAAYANSVEVLWTQLEGCWDADGEYFVEFSFQDGRPVFLSGRWEQPIPVGRPAGEVGSMVTFEGFYNVSVTYPALEEAADEQDLRTHLYTVMIGVEELDVGYLSVVAPDLPQCTYMRCGDSYQAALTERQ